MWKKNSNGDTFRWTKRAAIVIYDPLMVVLSENINKREYLVNIKDKIISRTKKLFENNDELLNGRNTSPSNVTTRIRIFRDFFSSL